jgi:hypothetical protein
MILSRGLLPTRLSLRRVVGEVSFDLGSVIFVAESRLIPLGNLCSKEVF